MPYTKVKMVAIAKDEGRYLAEWLYHHHHFGFDDFEIYLNNTSDNSRDVIQAVQSLLEVNITVVEADELSTEFGQHFQTRVYQRALRRTSVRDFSHVAFLDIDEFWTPRDFTTSINDYLAQSPTPQAVHVFNWAIKHRETRFGLAITDNNLFTLNSHIKCITPVRHELNTKVHNVIGDNVDYRNSEGRVAEFIDHTMSKTQISPTALPQVFIVHRLYRSQYEYVSSLFRGRPNGARFKSNRMGYAAKAKGVEYSPPPHHYEKYHQGLCHLNTQLSELLSRAERFVNQRYQALLDTLDRGVSSGEALILDRALRHITRPDIKPYQQRLKQQKIDRKIFQIGFNKSGTASIFFYFLNEGFKAIHWDKGKLSKQIHHNAKNNINLLTGYEAFQVFTDMEHRDDDLMPFYSAERYFQQLDQQYPDSIFILNYRDRDKWIKSRLNHPGYLARTMKATGQSRAQVIADWQHRYHQHINAVKTYFAERDNLIVIDLDKDPSDKLSTELSRLGFVLHNQHLPHTHQTRHRTQLTRYQAMRQKMIAMVPSPIKQKIKSLCFHVQTRWQ